MLTKMLAMLMLIGDMELDHVNYEFPYHPEASNIPQLRMSNWCFVCPNWDIRIFLASEQLVITSGDHAVMRYELNPATQKSLENMLAWLQHYNFGDFE